MIETSRIARPLTEEEVKSISAHHFPNQTIREITVLKGGLFNNTVRIDYAGYPSVVLRAGPVRRDLLLPFEYNLMEAEAEVDRLCSQHNIPCSRLLAVDTSKKLVNRDYMLVEYIPSVSLSDSSVPQSAKSELYRQTGRYMAMLHSIGGPCFGRVAKVVSGKGFSRWSEAILDELSDIARMLRKENLMEDSLLDDISCLFAGYSPLFDQVQKPRLVHTDLWEGNVLVQEDHGQWNVAAIIDGDRAFFGDPDYDFATPWMMTEDFIAGYGNIPIDTPERSIKRKLYRMLCDLTDAYVWYAEYENRENYLEKKAAVETALAELSRCGKDLK